MTLKDNIRRQCGVYIDAVLEGRDGELIRQITHAEFIRCLPGGEDYEFLNPVLHNLDKAIGLDTKGMTADDVSESQRRRWSAALFGKIWQFYESDKERQ